MATPVATAAIDVPFEPEFELGVLAPVDPDAGLRLPDEELRPRDEAAEDLRLDALAVLRLDALALFGLLREAGDLLRELAVLPPDEVLRLLLLEALLLFGLDPFELVDPDFRLVWERELAWAIAPP